MAFNNCPTCDRLIVDFDGKGCEAPDGQRWCLMHVPETSPDTWTGYDDEWSRWRAELFSPPRFTPYTPGYGLEEAEEDEGIEDTYFRLIIESVPFEVMDDTQREMFLLELAQQCISWVQERHNY